MPGCCESVGSGATDVVYTKGCLPPFGPSGRRRPQNKAHKATAWCTRTSGVPLTEIAVISPPPHPAAAAPPAARRPR